MTPRITEDKWNETHQTILNTAQQLFAVKGYNGTSMNDIVKESGVSKGAIYNHFESKERLFLSLMEVQTQVGFSQLEATFSDDDTSVDKLKKILAVTFSGSVSCPRELCMMQTEFMVSASRIESIVPELQKRYRMIRDFMVAIIEDGKRRGEIKEELDSESIVTLVFATLDGLGFQYSTLGIAFDTDRLLAQLMEMVLREIQP
ncbi:TetR/AcrR family transcriptional regulator [Candidatus Bathyarchaeota archaeon]|nr:TetR/AcrR family transcriptional regulator [Candidatus Bathyarchaeota archaeon]